MIDEVEEKRKAGKLRDLERQKKLRVDEFIREAMKLHQGREFFYWLLEVTHLHRNPFTANALTTSFACGEQNIGQQVQARIIDQVPTLFLKMLQEKQEEELNVRSEPNSNDDN